MLSTGEDATAVKPLPFWQRACRWLLVMSAIIALFILSIKTMELYDIDPRPSLHARGSQSSNVSPFLSPVVGAWSSQGNLSGVPLPGYPDVSGPCNCATNITLKQCCERLVVRAHKMGYEWGYDAQRVLHHLFNMQHDADIVQIDFTGVAYGPGGHWPETDFRSVVILRNLYSALISGYLYHKSGKECWLDAFGNPYEPMLPLRTHTNWRKYITTSVSSSVRDQYISFCHLLANESEQVGMHVYMEYGLHLYKVKNLFVHLALAENVKLFRERTKIACFEQVIATPLAETVQDWLGFFAPSSHYLFPPDWANKTEQFHPSTSNYSGGHATSHNPELQRELHSLIVQIDADYFDGKIAWLDSVIPCGK